MTSAKRLAILASAALASGLVMSCRPDPAVTPEPVVLNLSAQVMSLDYEDNSLFGKKADIGVFVTENGSSKVIGDNANVHYTADFTTGTIILTPADKPITLPEDGVRIDLAAYYPYSAALASDNGSEYLLHANLTDQNSLDPEMILLAQAENRNSVLHSAMLSLKPAYAKVKVTLKNANDVKSANQSIDVSIDGISCEADIDVLEGTYVSYGSASSTTLTRPVETSHMYEAVVLAQSVSDDAVLNVSINEGEHVSTVIKELIPEFKANTQYDITVTVSPAGIEATLVGMSDFFVSDWKEDYDEVSGETEQ